MQRTIADQADLLERSRTAYDNLDKAYAALQHANARVIEDYDRLKYAVRIPRHFCSTGPPRTSVEEFCITRMVV